ncbi:MAG: SHOCT domain-containing protein [Dehalococcoidales bacterium]|nr:SHOCT domain-containing protein [Dehalococcoidales bacterium]
MQGRDIATIILVIVLVILLFSLLGGGVMMWPGMMDWEGWGAWGGFSPFWGIVMLLFWVLVIAGVVSLVVWLFQQGRPRETGAAPGGRALDILRERYARGEITREEFERMRRDLEGR